MPELQEVYDMITKQTPPEPDALDRQFRKQRRTERNRRLGAIATVAALILALAAVILSTSRGDQPATTPSSSSASPVPVATHWYLNLATGERTRVAPTLAPEGRALEVSPNGEAVAYNTCCDPDDRIYVANLDGSSTELIAPENMNGYAPTWIDDETILYQGREARSSHLGDLYVADLSTGETTMVVDMPDRWVGAWIVVSDTSPDGTTVLFHLPRGDGDNMTYDLWTAPLTGGEPTLLREDAGFAQYGPDGSIVFLYHPYPFAADEIWTMDGDGTNARRLVGGNVGGNGYAWPSFSPDGTKVVFGDEDDMSHVVDVATGEVTPTNEANSEPAWYGNDTLIV